jgi:hypothetical protein
MTMRKFMLLAGLACLLAGAAGCDTKQPLQSGEQVLEISFNAADMTVYQYDVWDQYLDLDGDRELDPNETVQRWCQQVWSPPPNSERRTVNANSVPWPYSLKISIIRGGTMEPEVLTTNRALDSDFNLTPYDDWQDTFQPLPPTCQSNPDLVCLPLGRVSSANQLVMDTTFYQDEIFQCPGYPEEPAPRLDGTDVDPGSPPFSLNVVPGDTVVVEARKHTTGIGGLETITAEPSLEARIFLDGRPVTALGSTSSSKQTGAGISFSFTVQ